MKRIFIALKIDPSPNLTEMLQSLRSLAEGEKITWVDPVNIHLTLAFLGDIEEDRIKIAGLMLKKECSGFGEFTFMIKGAGLFKNLHDPRVIWIGIAEPEMLLSLNEKILTGLKDTGFRIEERPFKPHITIGRIKFLKNPEILKSFLGKYGEADIQQVDVREVILYESILRPAGPVYKSVGRFALAH
ncbi:MAG: RNA 2',3'-cyclic phosphodiesterase [Bacteroidales bacterium]